MSDYGPFKWDDAKAALKFAKHTVRFEVAIAAFADPNRVYIDVSRAADREVRLKAIGMIGGRLFTVVYTRRNETTRVISARRSSIQEIRRYDR